MRRLKRSEEYFYEVGNIEKLIAEEISPFCFYSDLSIEHNKVLYFKKGEKRILGNAYRIHQGLKNVIDNNNIDFTKLLCPFDNNSEHIYLSTYNRPIRFEGLTGKGKYFILN